MFQKMVVNDGILKVTDVSMKEEYKGRPSGLNTVNMLKVDTTTLFLYRK
jgi:DNA topoisomerase III